MSVPSQIIHLRLATLLQPSLSSEVSSSRACAIPLIGPCSLTSQGVYVIAFGVTGQQTTYFYNQVAATKGEDVRVRHLHDSLRASS